MKKIKEIRDVQFEVRYATNKDKQFSISNKLRNFPRYKIKVK